LVFFILSRKKADFMADKESFPFNLASVVSSSFFLL
jgi:hypothetical protein